jgi:hypothetical protein
MDVKAVLRIAHSNKKTVQLAGLLTIQKPTIYKPDFFRYKVAT